MSDHQRETIKSLIEERFNNSVRGKIPNLEGFNPAHDGAEGDWLTKEMGLTVNGKNEPDLMGFEMKKDSPKTSFGDWSPDTALYKRKGRGARAEMGRSEFLKVFGTAKIHTDATKNGRYSWSGEVFPTVKNVNKYGQVLKVLDNGDIVAFYYYSKDSRTDKSSIVPAKYQIEGLEIARWGADRLRSRLEKKFNQFGWFKCLTDSSGKYTKIQFGKPINYDSFLELVKKGEVFCDCGMHDGNARPYMTWRASHKIWEFLSE
jgi:hypothetical protein